MQPPLPAQDIIVTGQKRHQRLRDLPLSISVVSLDGIGPVGLASGSRELALSVDGLALTNLGSGRNRQFIRGVADSAFNGPSQSTVSAQLDEARVTFDAPDPDLRLVDMERVEVLKGPQGPLYGSGALGGIYHVVTRKPDLTEASGSARVIGEAIEHGGVGAGGEATVNLPLTTDKLALRGVGYVLREGGWIDNAGRNRNANRTVTDGGRLALRWQPDRDWTVDLAGVLQDIGVRDSQYVTVSDKTRLREARIPEPTDNDFRMIAATIQGRLGGLKLLATSSYVDHNVSYTLDSTDASPLFALSGPSRFDSDSHYTIVNHEVRLSPVGSSRWIAGISYLRARSHTIATVSTVQDSRGVEALDRYVTELAMFGEASIPLLEQLTVTAGARVSRSVAEDEAQERSAGSSDRITKTILSPSLSLAWTPSQRTLVYLRYARAVRPGGLAPADMPGAGRFDSDDLGTLDLGMRYASPGNRFAASASIYYTDWRHIQSDYLLANGLVATRNAGHGRIFGLEASVDWLPAAGLRLSVGGSFIDAVLVSSENGLALDDRRLPVVPDFTGRLTLEYGFDLGEWKASLTGQANYVGKARLAFDPALDRQMGGYLPLAATATFARDRVVLSARIDNLMDIKGDSFAFGNQFSILNAPQYTPLRPRTFTLSISRSW
ncbi:TonB-dependent receptor [Novosphingobium sp. G106]|uniref:TonB-dependent receptor n=1 Tax=Novosphingobium sp. G106 TaxID=2849500 RepID=UPI001C2DE346|nr:TonB-dependent receptor [Novosphingobium sp. G106]MBV1692620.1 TonB-dependent receptor [Novosphingobium sp. G106]